jgi:adenosylcobyric acid synthase
LQTVWDEDGDRAEGARCGQVWGTYLHGWFESPDVRRSVTNAAGFAAHRPYLVPWAVKRQAIYTEMAKHVAAHVDLESVCNYLGL